MSSLRKVVLVAEDQALIRMVAADFLRAAGYDVLEAGHAAAALSILLDDAPTSTRCSPTSTWAGPDVWPWIALLVVSRLASPDVPDMPPGARFLPKPYGPGNVVAHLVEMMPVPSAGG